MTAIPRIGSATSRPGSEWLARGLAWVAHGLFYLAVLGIVAGFPIGLLVLLAWLVLS
jgi:hypothetical protein